VIDPFVPDPTLKNHLCWLKKLFVSIILAEVLAIIPITHKIHPPRMEGFKHHTKGVVIVESILEPSGAASSCTSQEHGSATVTQIQQQSSTGLPDPVAYSSVKHRLTLL
jgi:hypothetical protein